MTTDTATASPDPTGTRHERAVRQLADLETQAGEIQPEPLVLQAQAKDHPLHWYFDWNDESAAHAHRVEQARRLIRSVRVEVRNRQTTVRTVQYVRDPRAGARDQGYINIERLTAPELAEQTVRSEVARVASMIRRGYGIASALDREDQFLEGVRAAVDNPTDD